MHFASVCHRGVETEGDITGEPTDSLPYRNDHLAVATCRANYGDVGKKEVDECRAGKNVSANSRISAGSGHVLAINLCRAGIELEGREGAARAQRTAPPGRRRRATLGQMAKGNFAV